MGSIYDESWELESLRRSLVMCAPEGPATSLTNRDASQLISRVQAMEEELKMLRSGVAVLLHRTTPVPRLVNKVQNNVPELIARLETPAVDA